MKRPVQTRERADAAQKGTEVPVSGVVMSAVGFETTSANTVELESTPLDRSGTLTIKYALPPQIYTHYITK